MSGGSESGSSDNSGSSFTSGVSPKSNDSPKSKDKVSKEWRGEKVVNGSGQAPTGYGECQRAKAIQSLRDGVRPGKSLLKGKGDGGAGSASPESGSGERKGK